MLPYVMWGLILKLWLFPEGACVQMSPIKNFYLKKIVTTWPKGEKVKKPKGQNSVDGHEQYSIEGAVDNDLLEAMILPRQLTRQARKN